MAFSSLHHSPGISLLVWTAAYARRTHKYAVYTNLICL